MKRIALWGIALTLLVGVWGCSNNDNLPEDDHLLEENTSPEPEAWVYGRLMDARTGRPVGSSTPVNISAGERTASMKGGFFFIKLPVDREHLLVIEAPTDKYPRTSHRVMAQEGVSTFVEFWMLSFEQTEKFDVNAQGAIETPEGAKVVFPAGSLNATGEVTARLAWLNAANPNHLSAFPGGFRTDTGELLESFSAIAIEVRDAEGALVNLREGARAQARIPATSNVPADVIPLWVYDEEAGHWIEEGELTDCLSGTCLTELPHLSWWNIDIPLTATCLKVCVTDTNGNPVVGAYIEASGVDYNGITANFSGADGCACLLVRINSHVEVKTATTWDGAVDVKTVNPTSSNPLLSCGDPECPQVSLQANFGKFEAILTWGETPEDLDAHFTGPCSDSEQDFIGAICQDGRFHIFYGSWGWLWAPPFAALSGDIRSGYGPEVVSLTACSEGSYRYSVLNPSGEGFANSQAQVTLLLPDGSLLSYSVDAFPNPENLPHWIVGELQCEASCECTWVPLNTFEHSELPEKLYGEDYPALPTEVWGDSILQTDFNLT